MRDAEGETETSPEDGSPRSDGHMLEEVRDGLTGVPKELPPKYFYDRRGSELFEEITRLPEYYLTRAELEILRGSVREWILDFAPASLVELGAGSARKTRVLLDAMTEARSRALFVPVDVSAEFLAEAARELRADYPDLAVEPAVADIASPLDLGVTLRRPALVALLGSTIGNFRRPQALELLHRVRGLMSPSDAFLMGADLRPGPGKPVERLEAAYDDDRGVTARFNRNMLRVLNRELGTDFDPGAFEHRSFYDAVKDRIEMHLVARKRQSVRLPDGTEVTFEHGESVRTEISCKYDRATVAELFDAAGLELVEWLADSAGRYAMAVARPAGRSSPG